jgi:hypothetical protein
MSDPSEPLALAREIVERHVLRPEERIREVRTDPAGIVVETDVIPWIVRRVGKEAPDYELYEVVPGFQIDPPPVPAGIAVVAPGKSFRLNDPEGFREFWTAVGGSLRPEAVAELLAAYRSGDYRGHVIGSELDPAPRRWAARLESVSGCAPLRVEEDGKFSLRFCAYSVVPTEPEGEDHLVVTRWSVTADRAGSIDWSSEPVATLPID